MKNKSTTKPWKEAQPYLLGAAGDLKGQFGQTSGMINDLTQQGVGAATPLVMDRLENGNPGVTAAQDYGTSVLGGEYLNNNPHLQDVIDMTNADVADAVNANMSLRGLTGGSNHAGVLGKQLSQNTANLRYGDYARERGAMDSAAGRAGQLSAAEYLPISGLLSTIGAAGAPLDAAGRYAGSLGGLFGGYNTTTQKQGLGSTLAGLAGSGLAGWASGGFASERRVKRNIEHIGKLPDGLGVYNFRYLWDGDDEPLRTGVMVDEVEVLRPWALGPVVDGIRTVDYHKLENA